MRTRLLPNILLNLLGAQEGRQGREARKEKRKDAQTSEKEACKLLGEAQALKRMNGFESHLLLGCCLQEQ